MESPRRHVGRARPGSSCRLISSDGVPETRPYPSESPEFGAEGPGSGQVQPPKPRESRRGGRPAPLPPPSSLRETGPWAVPRHPAAAARHSTGIVGKRNRRRRPTTSDPSSHPVRGRPPAAATPRWTPAGETGARAQSPARGGRHPAAGTSGAPPEAGCRPGAAEPSAR